MDQYYAPTNVQYGGSANLPATNELPVDMYAKTFKAFPSITPMTVIMSKMADDPATNFRVDWIEEEKIPTLLTVAVSESSAPTGTSNTVYFAANCYTCVLNTLLFNPRTYDLREVDTAPTSDTSLSLTAAAGGTTTAAWKSGDPIHVLPPAIAENDNDNYRPISVANTNVYNLVQICKIQFSLTRLMDKLSTVHGGAGSMRKMLKAQKYYEFREKSEKLIYFGGRASSGSSYSTKRTMGGLIHYLRNGSLYKDFGGIMTESGFRNYLGDYKDQNPEAVKAYMFCAGNVVDLIDEWGLNNVRLSPDSEVYGFDIWKYKSRGLMVNLVSLPLLTDSVTRGWGFILDMERIKLRYVDKPMYYPEALNVGQSELIYDTYRQALSMLIGSESRHSMFVNALV